MSGTGQGDAGFAPAVDGAEEHTGELGKYLRERKLGVIEVTPEGLVLREVALGVTAEAVQKATDPKLRVASDLKTMQV